MAVPYFRPDLRAEEIDEVCETLRSGWLTTGPRTVRFEREFAAAVGADRAVAMNSATAAMHVATVALGLRRGDAVLVPTMTFAATAEVVTYAGATPILVDCDADSLAIDLEDARAKIERLHEGSLVGLDANTRVVGIMPVHVAGLMVDMSAVHEFAAELDLWVVEDAAHAFPASYRGAGGWRRAGQNTATVTCFSFYANKTITTGEGGMAVTSDAELAERMRCLSLHGLSSDAWGRYRSEGSWDYRIVAPGYKYNLTDIAAALGIHQLARAESMRDKRRDIAERYGTLLTDLERTGRLELPSEPEDRRHAWHLYQVRVAAEAKVDRSDVIQRLAERDIGTSVHWRPLHLHPLYEEAGWQEDDCPVASEVWQRLLSLPIFPGMSDAEVREVASALRAAMV